MILEKDSAVSKLAKIHQEQGHIELALSDAGYLLLKQGHVFQNADFRLFTGGQWYRRKGFDFSASAPIPAEGLVVGSVAGRKILAPRGDGQWEYATPKRRLCEDFVLFLLVRLEGRILIIIADGSFSSEVSQIALTDSPANEIFAFALLKQLVGLHDQAAAEALVKEESDEKE